MNYDKQDIFSMMYDTFKITKQQIDTLLSIVKPSNEQEEQLLKCVRYDLYKAVDEVERANKKLEESKDGKNYLENMQLKSERIELKYYIERLQNEVIETQNQLRKTKIKLRQTKDILKSNPDFRKMAKIIKWYMESWDD